MPYFAGVDEKLEVQQVRSIPSEQEHRGEEYLAHDLGLGGMWIQTSYNATIRGRFAAPGMIYDEGRDIFRDPQPFLSWSFNETEMSWQPPVPYPDDGQNYTWSEEEGAWVLFTSQ